MKNKISLIVCLLAAIFLFAGCWDNSQEASQVPPEAPAQTTRPAEEKESVPLETPVREAVASAPATVEEETPALPETPVQETADPAPAVVEEKNPAPEPVEEETPAPPEPSPEEPPEETPQAVTYVLNTNTMKFHKPHCRSVKQIKPQNRLDTVETREDVVAKGYSPCGNCKP